MIELLRFLARVVVGALPPLKQIAVRSANVNGVDVLATLRVAARSRQDTVAMAVDREARIVVVGAGPSALALVRELTGRGFKRVTLIAPEDGWGGTCVRLGCMPMAHVFSPKGADGAARRAALAMLVEYTKAAFESLPCTFVSGRAMAVLGREILMEDGRRIDFDRVVLAVGSGSQASGLSLETFWSLTRGCIAIVSPGHPGAISLASAALRLGLRPTLVLTRDMALGHLPSFAYFLAKAMEEGVEVVGPGSVTLRRAENGGLTIRTEIGCDPLAVDHVLEWSPGSPPPLPVDGKPVTGLTVNPYTLALWDRQDVFVLGDAAGLFSAAEGELSGRLLAQSWAEGTSLDLDTTLQLPQMLHGFTPLAMVGSLESLFSTGWQQVDFAELGITTVLGETGKLWFLPGRSGQHVAAMHICHPEAAELIATAATLLRHPVTDPIWTATSVHPSRSEIFRVVAARMVDASVHASARVKQTTSRTATTSVVAIERVPATLVEFRQMAQYQGLFSRPEESAALLRPNPYEYLLVALGLKMLLRSEGVEPASPLVLRQQESGEYFHSRYAFELYRLGDSLRVQRQSRAVVFWGASESALGRMMSTNGSDD